MYIFINVASQYHLFIFIEGDNIHDLFLLNIRESHLKK